MKSQTLAISLFIILSSCVGSKNISSFDCSYSSNGTSRVSESIVLKPKITTIKGVNLIPQDPSSTQLIARYDNRTSKTLKEYNIKIIGGTRVGNTAEITIDGDPTEIINKRLQVFISLKKDTHFADTIDFLVDYKGGLSLNFDATNPGSHAKDIFVSVHKVEDSTYYSNFNCQLYKIEVTNGTSSKSYLMSEKTASLLISNKGANGANGTSGVNGKNGAPGKDGADGFKGKDGEAGGDGSDGVNGGNGGNGGSVFITMDSECSEFQGLVNCNNQGGHGGHGGTGGVGGVGGKGGLGGNRLVGENVLGERKSSGNTGNSGNNGRDGQNGLSGTDGPRIEYIIK